MCSINEANEKIKAVEKYGDQPDKARRLLLEAAEIYLSNSMTNKDKEAEYVETAQRLYAISRTIKSDPAPVVEDEKPPQPSGKKILFRDIGGLEELKDEVRMKIIEPFKHPDIFKYFDKQARGGILMYGPPGCGKSLIAEATSNEAGCTFFNVKASDLKSKYVGETEKNIAELFEKARANQPSIIFFDEFDAVGGDRSQSMPADKAALAQLLAEMDGVGTKDQQILLLAATNAPWSIDAALRRDGRFGQTIFVPQPDAEARREILDLKLKNKPTDGVDINELAIMTKDYSGADIASVVEAATEIPLKEYLKTKNLRKINMQDFRLALKKRKSIVIPWFEKALHEVQSGTDKEYFSELLESARKLMPQMVVA